MEELDNAIEQGQYTTMCWLENYSDVANFTNVDGQFDVVIAKLEKAGYSEEDSSFDNEKTVITSDILVKHAVAQLLTDIKGGYPHPVPTAQMVAEYKILKEQENNTSQKKLSDKSRFNM